MLRRFAFGLAAIVVVAASARAQTAAEAAQFVQRANKELLELQIRATRAQWIQQNFITDDTETLNAEASNELAMAFPRLAQEAKRFDKITVPPDIRRQLTLLKISVVTQGTTAVAPPGDPKEASELASLIAANDGAYGKGKYCKSGGTCLDINAIAARWRRAAIPPSCSTSGRDGTPSARRCGPRYERFVALANKGARELGYADNGALWRSIYDMPPEQFDKELDRLWTQLRAALQIAARLRAPEAERAIRQLGRPGHRA